LVGRIGKKLLFFFKTNPLGFLGFTCFSLFFDFFGTKEKEKKNKKKTFQVFFFMFGFLRVGFFGANHVGRVSEPKMY